MPRSHPGKLKWLPDPHLDLTPRGIQTAAGSPSAKSSWLNRFSRRMVRVLQSHGVDAHLSELKGKEHWW